MGYNFKMGNKIEELNPPNMTVTEILNATEKAKSRVIAYIGLITIAGTVAAILYSRCNPVSARAEGTNLNSDRIYKRVISGEDLNRLPPDVISVSMLPEILQFRQFIYTSSLEG